MSEMTIFPRTDWETGPAQENGWNVAALEKASRLLAAPGSNARAFLIIQNGVVVWEKYFQDITSQSRMHLFSVTKSVTSALVGLALADGRMGGVEQNVLDFFPEFPLPPGSALGSMRLRHLLSMTSGFLWPAGHHGKEPMIQRLWQSPEWTRFILSLPVKREQMGRFNYCSPASHLLALIVARAEGLPVVDFANQRLFTPLGIAPVQAEKDWELDPQGNAIGGWGLHLTARELARFAWLYLNAGQWAGGTIIDPRWVAESLHLPPDLNKGYGYQWWLRRGAAGDVFAALGMGGQYCFCVPERRAAVLILSAPALRWPDRWPLLDLVLGH